MKGKTLGQWTIEELIDDSGGNGIVWRVSNPTGQIGALKMLQSFADPNKASKRRKRFVNEISKLEMIKTMGIAGVMPILDYDAEHEPPWFVMPLASGLNQQVDQLEREGWKCALRYFYAGEVENVAYDLALSFCRFQTRGEARLILKATISIRVEQEAHILASIDLETYTTGPQVEQMRKDLFAFVQEEETQYRAIEKLKELSK